MKGEKEILDKIEELDKVIDELWACEGIFIGGSGMRVEVISQLNSAINALKWAVGIEDI